jgi:hypothetical protein
VRSRRKTPPAPSTARLSAADARPNVNFEGGVNEVENTIIAEPLGGGANCAGADATSDGFNDDFSPTGASCFGTPALTDRTDDPLLAAAGLQPNAGLLGLHPADTEHRLPGPARADAAFECKKKK